MNSPSILDALKEASRGLLYISETEAPLEALAWPGGVLSAERLKQLAGAAADAEVEETTLNSFLRTVPAEDRPAFDKLAGVLQELSSVKVYKIGAGPERQVYVVGTTTDGCWAGVKTLTVET